MISDKQVKLYNKIIERESSEIYVQGSVQSGKTWVIALAVIGYTKELFKYDPDKKYNGAIIGWDLDTLKRNVVTPLLNFLDDLGYTNGDEYELKWGNEKYFKFLNMTYFFFGFNTKLSFNKILGGPLLFVWIDESARIYSNSTLQEPFDEIPRQTNELCRASV